MPISEAIDHVRRQVRSRATASVTLGDILAHLERERTASGLPYTELIDARGYHPDFSAAEVRSIVDRLRRLGKMSRLGATAVVVDSDVGFGMVRMLEIMVEDVCAIRPFRNQEEAELWLASFGR
jgi:hypothetical protein